MKHKLLKKYKKNKGFTLIELLAVILILGIIALIAIPTVSGVVKESRKGSAVSTGNQIVKSVEQYITMCDLNNGYDSNGNKCSNDLKKSGYSNEELADVIGVKGDLPDMNDIIVLEVNDDGNVSFSYRKGSFTCTNMVDSDGNISYKNTGLTNSNGVVCGEDRITNSGTIMLDTNGKKNVLKSYDGGGASLTDDFKNSSYNDKIIKIFFVNTTSLPEGYIESWDVSASNNGSILSWIVTDPDDASKYDLYIGSEGDIYANSDSSYLFSGLMYVKEISFLNFYTDDVTNMSNMFKNAYSIESIDISGFNTSKVTNMNSMFRNMINLKYIDISGIDTSNVTNMSYMFGTDKPDISIYEEIKGIEYLNTSNVTDMSYMFARNKGMTSLDLSKWNTNNVTTIVRMFNNSYNLKSVNLTGWTTPKLTGIDHIFSTTDASNPMQIESVIGIENLNTSKVTDMSGLFYKCPKLISLDLSGWNTSLVNNMYGMFGDNTSLEVIYVGSGWNVDAVTNSQYMLSRTYKLRNYDGKTYDKTVANTGSTGYLTYKEN